MAEYIEREAAVAVFEERQKALCPVGEWSRNKAYDREKFDTKNLDSAKCLKCLDEHPDAPPFAMDKICKRGVYNNARD